MEEKLLEQIIFRERLMFTEAGQRIYELESVERPKEITIYRTDKGDFKELLSASIRKEAPESANSYSSSIVIMNPIDNTVRVIVQYFNITNKV